MDAIVQGSISEAPHIDEGLCIDCDACASICRTFVQVEDPEPAVADA